MMKNSVRRANNPENYLSCKSLKSLKKLLAFNDSYKRNNTYLYSSHHINPKTNKLLYYQTDKTHFLCCFSIN